MSKDRITIFVFGAILLYMATISTFSRSIYVPSTSFHASIPIGEQYIIPGDKYVRCTVDGEAYSRIPHTYSIWSTGPTIYSSRMILKLSGGYGVKNEGNDVVHIECV